MITVPTLGDDRVTLNPTNTQRVQTQAPDFGDRSQQQLSNSVGQLAQTALKVEQAEIQKANQIIDMESDTRLGELETDLLYNVDSGAFNKKGKDAFGTPDTVTMDWDFGVQEIEKTLSSDSQRAAFRKRVQQRKANIDKNLMRHVSKESLQYDNQVTESYIANEKNSALENFFDPDRVDSSVARQRQAIINHADRNGLPAEYKKQKIQELQSETYSGVITRILDGGADIEANEYYQKNKHLITAEHQRGIEKQLEVGMLIGKSQRITDDIFNKTKDSRQALDQARKIRDPKVRDAVVKRVKSRISEEKMLDAESDKNAFDKAFHIVRDSGKLNIPPSIMSRLRPGQIQNLENYLKKKLSGDNSTDVKTRYNLRLMSADPRTRNKFARLNLNEYADKLNNSDMKEMEKIQAGIIKGKSETLKELDGIQSKSSIVNNALKIMDIDEDDTEDRALFAKVVDDEINRRQDETGKKISRDELRQIVGKLSTEHIVGKKLLFFDKTKRNFKIDTSQIPDSEYNRLKNLLEIKGHEADDQKILELYKLGLEKK